MKLESYVNNCPSEIIEEIKQLVEDCSFDEHFAWDADCFFVGRNEKAIIGVVVYKITDMEEMGKFPRFLHIIINKPYQRTKQALFMLIESEKELLKMGYKNIIAEIEHTLSNKEMKTKYAQKFGYEKYHTDKHSDFLIKNIGGLYV